jgi:benzoate/toluate 1,2-dioxygenase reductase component
MSSPLEARLLRRSLLAPGLLELTLSRPPGFLFTPGQSVSLSVQGVERDYSIASGADEPVLRFLVRLVTGGAMSGRLSSLADGAVLGLAGPRGFLTHEPSARSAVLIATGTGIAPFLSMLRSGLRGVTLLHGVARAEDLVYADEARSAAGRFVACVSRGPAPAGTVAGRVTAGVQAALVPGAFDFYLCGRKEMVRDMTVIIDTRFPGSTVRTEIFY